MIDVAFAVMQRLVDGCQQQFAFVGSLADFAALGDVPRVTPAAYVVPLSEQAAPSETYGQSSQHHEMNIGVLYVVRHAGDGTGARAASALHELREAVHAQLVGWRPPGCSDYLQFANGDIAELVDGGTLVWRDQFLTQRLVQRALPTT